MKEKYDLKSFAKGSAHFKKKSIWHVSDKWLQKDIIWCKYDVFTIVQLRIYSILCTYCLLQRNLRSRITLIVLQRIYSMYILHNCTGKFVVVILIVLRRIYIYKHIIYWRGTVVVVILIVLLRIFSMYILFIVQEHLWS